ASRGWQSKSPEIRIALLSGVFVAGSPDWGVRGRALPSRSHSYSYSYSYSSPAQARLPSWRLVRGVRVGVRVRISFGEELWFLTTSYSSPSSGTVVEAWSGE